MKSLCNISNIFSFKVDYWSVHASLNLDQSIPVHSNHCLIISPHMQIIFNENLQRQCLIIYITCKSPLISTSKGHAI